MSCSIVNNDIRAVAKELGINPEEVNAVFDIVNDIIGNGIDSVNLFDSTKSMVDFFEMFNSFSKDFNNADELKRFFSLTIKENNSINPIEVISSLIDKELSAKSRNILRQEDYLDRFSKDEANDNVDDFINTFLDGKNEVSVSDIIEKIASLNDEYVENGIYKVISDTYKKLGCNVKVKFLDRYEDMELTRNNERAYYDSSTNTIVINKSKTWKMGNKDGMRFSQISQSIMHEVTHVITHKILHSKDNYKKGEELIEKIKKEAQKADLSIDEYGFKNPDELLAELMNGKFMNHLRQITMSNDSINSNNYAQSKVEEVKKNFIERVLDMLKEFFDNIFNSSKTGEKEANTAFDLTKNFLYDIINQANNTIINDDIVGIVKQEDDSSLTKRKQNDAKDNTNGIQYTEEQVNAINKCVNWLNKKTKPGEYYTFIGKAGTGKTTCAKKVISDFRKANPNAKIVMGALSWQATEVLERSVGTDSGASFLSIASMLSMREKEDPDTGKQTFERPDGFEEMIANNEIKEPATRNSQLIVIDECSMIGEQQLDILIDDIVNHNPNAKLLFLGDDGQLNPIGETAISQTFSKYGEENHSRLVTRMRQGEDNPILEYADQYWENSHTDKDESTKNMVASNDNINSKGGIVTVNKISDQIDSIIELFKRQNNGDNPFIAKCLYRTNNEAFEANRKIHKKLFQNSKTKYCDGEFVKLYEPVRVELPSDKKNKPKIDLRNQKEYKIVKAGEETYEELYGVRVDYQPLTIKVKNGNKEEEITIKALTEKGREQLTKAGSAAYRKGLYKRFKNTDVLGFCHCENNYAITVHKSQGSTYDVTFVDEDSINEGKNNLERSRSLYTAITRSRNITVVANSKATKTDKNVNNLNNEINEVKAGKTGNYYQIDNKDVKNYTTQELINEADFVYNLADFNPSNEFDSQENFNTLQQSEQVLNSEKTILSNAELKIWNEQGITNPRILTASEHSDPVFHVNQIIDIINGEKSVDKKDYIKISKSEYDKLPYDKRYFNQAKGIYYRVDTTELSGKDFNGLYIITKHDGLPMKKLLETKIPKIIHFTITGLGQSQLEPGVMKYNDMLDKIQEYIKMGLDPNIVTIRIDPIVPSVTKFEDIENIISRASKMGIKRIKFSIMDAYPKTITALIEQYSSYDWEGIYGENAGFNKNLPISATNSPYNFHAKKEIIEEIYDFMLKCKNKYGVELHTCAEPIKRNGIEVDGCLSVKAVNKMLGTNIKDKGFDNNNQRQKCSCYGGKIDSLAYNDSCASHCIYCYARHANDKAIQYYDENGKLKNNIFTITNENNLQKSEQPINPIGQQGGMTDKQKAAKQKAEEIFNEISKGGTVAYGVEIMPYDYEIYNNWLASNNGIVAYRMTENPKEAYKSLSPEYVKNGIIGNPFSGVKKGFGPETVMKFIHWICDETATYGEKSATPELRNAIREKISEIARISASNGSDTGKVLYYENKFNEDGTKPRPSHGTAIAYLIKKTIEKHPEWKNSSKNNDIIPNYTLYSGGAQGADELWDMIGREYGLKNAKHLRMEGKNVKSHNVSVTHVSKKKMLEAQSEMNRILGTSFNIDSTNESFANSSELQVRNYWQAKKADAIFAMVPKHDIGSVTGGTKMAVMLGIEMGKEVHVFDASEDRWYIFDNENGFVEEDTPVLTPNFAGIGSRTFSDAKDNPERDKFNKEYTNRVINAMRNVYQKTILNNGTANKKVQELRQRKAELEKQIENARKVAANSINATFKNDNGDITISSEKLSPEQRTALKSSVESGSCELEVADESTFNDFPEENDGIIRYFRIRGKNNIISINVDHVKRDKDNGTIKIYGIASMKPYNSYNRVNSIMFDEFIGREQESKARANSDQEYKRDEEASRVIGERMRDYERYVAEIFKSKIEGYRQEYVDAMTKERDAKVDDNGQEVDKYNKFEKRNIDRDIKNADNVKVLNWKTPKAIFDEIRSNIAQKAKEVTNITLKPFAGPVLTNEGYKTIVLDDRYSINDRISSLLLTDKKNFDAATEGMSFDQRSLLETYWNENQETSGEKWGYGVINDILEERSDFFNELVDYFDVVSRNAMPEILRENGISFDYNGKSSDNNVKKSNDTDENTMADDGTDKLQDNVYTREENVREEFTYEKGTRSMHETLTKEVVEALRTIPEYINGVQASDSLGNPRYIDEMRAYTTLQQKLNGIKSSIEMVERIGELAELRESYKTLYDKIKGNKPSDWKLRTMLYESFNTQKKNFWINRKSVVEITSKGTKSTDEFGNQIVTGKGEKKNVSILKAYQVNSSKTEDVMVANAVYNITNGLILSEAKPIYTPNGNVNTNNVIENYEKLKNMTSNAMYKNALVAINQGRGRSYLKKDGNRLVKRLTIALESLGIEFDKDYLINKLSSKPRSYNKVTFGENGYIGTLIDILNRTFDVSNTDLYDKNGDSYYIKMDKLEDEIKKISNIISDGDNGGVESTTRNNGKQMMSFQQPSYLSKLVDNIKNSQTRREGTRDNGKYVNDFLENEFGKYRYFKTTDENGNDIWHNCWLRDWNAMETFKPQNLDSMVLLHSDNISYDDFNDARHHTVLMNQYFAKMYDNEGNRTKNNDCWFAVPVLANAPSCEFIKARRRVTIHNSKIDAEEQRLAIKAYYEHYKDNFNSEVSGKINEWIKTLVRPKGSLFEKMDSEIVCYYELAQVAKQEMSRIAMVIERANNRNKAVELYNKKKAENKGNIRIVDIRSMEGWTEGIDNLDFPMPTFNKDTLDAIPLDLTKAKMPRGAKFCFFPEFNKKRFGVDKNMSLIEYLGVDMNNPNYDPLKDKTILEKVMDCMIEVQSEGFRDSMETWKKDGVFNKEDNGFGDNSPIRINNNGELTRSSIESLRDYYLQSSLAYAMIQQLTITDPAYYKNANDFQKRNKQIYSPSKKLDTNSKYARKIERTLILKDIEVMSGIQFEDIKSIMEYAIGRNDIVVDDKEGFYKKLKKDFDEINLADAQAFCSPSSYRAIMDMAGELSDELEDTLGRMIGNRKDESGNTINVQKPTKEQKLKDSMVTMMTKKPFVYTQSSIDSGTQYGLMKVGNQQKNSINPLFWNTDICRKYANEFDAKKEEGKNGLTPNAKKLIQLVKFMEDYDIDIVQFESAIKVGGKAKIDISNVSAENNNFYEYLKQATGYDHLKDETGKPTCYKDVISEYSYDDYGIQASTPEHLIDIEQLVGSQIRRLAIADIDDNAIFSVDINGRKRSMTKNQFVNHYNAIITENILENFRELDKTFSNVEKIEKLLIDEMRGNKQYTPDMIKAARLTTLPDGNKVFDLISDPVVSDKIESLLNSIIRSRITKQKIKGGACIQVSCFGMEGLHVKTSKVKKIDNEGKEITITKVDYMECMLPPYSKDMIELLMDEEGFVDFSKINEICDKETAKALTSMIGYRVPTEDKYSMAPLKVVGFLPPNNGSVIMLPAEITTLSGSDFDVDKMYLMLHEFKRVVDIRFKKGDEGKNQRSAFIKRVKEVFSKDGEIIDENIKKILSYKREDGTQGNIINDIEEYRANGIDISDDMYNKYNRVFYKIATLLTNNKDDIYKKAYRRFTTGKNGVEFFETLKVHRYHSDRKQKDENDNSIYDNKLACGDEASRNSREARNNRMIDLMYSSLTNENTASKFLLPGSFDIQKKSARIIEVYEKISPNDIKKFFEARNVQIDTNDYYGNLKSLTLKEIDSLLENYAKDINPISPTTQVYFHSQNANGEKLIGVYANHNCGHALMQYTHLSIKGNEMFVLDGKELNSLHSNKHFISKQNSGFLAASVDNVKDPVLSWMNQNGYTADSAMLLSRLGYDSDTIAILMNQPILKKVTELFKNGEIGDKKSLFIKACKEYFKDKSFDNNRLIEIHNDNKADGRKQQFMSNVLAMELMKSNEQILDESKNADSYSMQERVAGLLYHIIGIAEDLSTLTQVTKVDTQNGGLKSKVSDNISKIRKGKEFMNRLSNNKTTLSITYYDKDGKPMVDKILYNIEDNFGDFTNGNKTTNGYNELRKQIYDTVSPMISAFGFCGVQITERYFKNLFPQYNTAIQNMFNSFTAMKGEALTGSEINSIYKDLVVYWMSDIESFGTDKYNNARNLNIQDKRRLFVDSFPDKFMSYLNNSEDMRNIEFLNKLKVKEVKRVWFDSNKIKHERIIKTLTFPNVGSLDPELKAKYSWEWEKMFYSEDVLQHDCAVKLLIYSYFRNGLGFGPDAFGHLAPLMRTELTGYRERFRELITFNDESKLEGFIEQYVRNHPYSSFVKKIDNYEVSDIVQEYAAENELIDQTYGYTKGKDDKKMFISTRTPNIIRIRPENIRTYIKGTFNFINMNGDIFKMCEIGGDYVYIKMSKLGFVNNSDKTEFPEYNVNGVTRSIFEENNINTLKSTKVIETGVFEKIIENAVNDENTTKQQVENVKDSYENAIIDGNNTFDNDDVNIYKSALEKELDELYKKASSRVDHGC